MNRLPKGKGRIAMAPTISADHVPKPPIEKLAIYITKCIETRMGVPLLEVESALRTMARTFKLVIAVGACQSCRRTDATFSVAGPVK